MTKHIGARKTMIMIRLISALLATTLLLACTAAAGQENLVRNGGAETGTLDNWTGTITVIAEGAHGGKFAFRAEKGQYAESSDMIPVDPEKTYELSAWIMSIGAAANKVRLGLAPYDANRLRIESSHVTVIQGTDTVLAAPCAKSDTVLKIADGAKWAALSHACVAFETDASGHLSDLPNRKLTPPGIANMERKDNGWEVVLDKPCGREYPAGTPVREHGLAGSAVWAAANGSDVPSDWTCFVGDVAGVARQAVGHRQWWPGTRYVRVFVQANCSRRPNQALLLDAIQLVEKAGGSAASEPQPMTIVSFGDSTTAKRGNLKVYSMILQDGLPALGLRARVVNAGIGGNTTVAARARFQADVLGHYPNLVIIQFGINDAAVNVWANPPETAPRVSLEDYTENLRYFVRSLRAAGSQVILMTPNVLTWQSPMIREYYGKPPYDINDPKGFNVVMVRYVAAVRAIAAEMGVPLVDMFAAYEDYAAQPGKFPDALLLDGMHPNAEGQKLVAELLLPKIRECAGLMAGGGGK